MQLRRRVAQRGGRQRALQKTVHRRGKKGRRAGGKRVKRAEALLFPAVRGRHTVTQLPFARKQQLRFDA